MLEGGIMLGALDQGSQPVSLRMGIAALVLLLRLLLYRLGHDYLPFLNL